MANQIIAIVGLCGSGKTEAVNFLIAKGYRRVYFGAPTFIELEKQGKPVNEANERAIREELRKKHGMAAMAILSIGLVRQELLKGNVVIESLYSWEEFKVIKKEFGEQFKVIALHTSKSLRYARLANRPNRPLTKEKSISRDLSEIENLSKGGPIAYADALIVNDGSLAELETKVSVAITTILAK